MSSPAMTVELEKLRHLLRSVDIDPADEEVLQLVIQAETNIPEIAAHIIEAINEVQGMVDGATAAEARIKAAAFGLRPSSTT